MLDAKCNYEGGVAEQDIFDKPGVGIQGERKVISRQDVRSGWRGMQE